MDQNIGVEACIEMNSASRTISLVNEFVGQTVIWADDRVLLSKSEVAEILQRHPEVESSAFWQMNRSWSRSIKAGLAITYGERNFHESASMIIATCKAHSRNLKLVDFRTAHEICREDGDYLYLLDLQNLCEPLGFTRLTNGETDERWNWAIYGAEFAKCYEISSHRFRFASRYSGERGISETDKRKTEDIVFEALKNIYPALFRIAADVAVHSIRFDDVNELQEQLGTFFTLNSHYRDPRISDAIAFALSPPGGTWQHNELKPKGTQCAAFQKWIRKTVACESAMALFLGPNQQMPWSVNPTVSRPIAPDVLAAVCAKVGVDVQIQPSIREIGLPIQPGVPFILSLGALIGTMKTDPDYHAPQRLEMSADNGRFSLRLVLDKRQKMPGKAISPQKLVDAYNVALQKHKSGTLEFEDGQRLISLHLVRLTHGLIQLEHQIDKTKQPFFAGTPVPVADVSADEINSAIILSWPRTS